MMRFLLLFVLLGLPLFGEDGAADTRLMSRPVQVIGHRGSSGNAPENTLAAIERAFLEGASAVEIDAHLSSDGEIVVIHDATVNRTTDGVGAVANMTLSELKELDAGSWFGAEFSDEKIPTLAEVLIFAKGKGIIYLDVKTLGQADGIAEAVAETGFDVADLWIWVNGNEAEREEMRRVLAGAQLIWPAPDTEWITDPFYFESQREAGVVGFSSPKSAVNSRFIARAKAEGMFVEVFTLVEREDFLRVAAAGADFIETDFPAFMQTLQPVRLAAASGPQPVDSAMRQTVRPILAWIPGEGAIDHRIYFGESNPPLFVAEQGSDLFETPRLEPDTTYYWRVEEVTPAGLVQGPVWSFRTASELSADGFEWLLSGSLNASRGTGVLSFAGGAATESRVSFETSDGDLVPHMRDGAVDYLRIPAFTDRALGLDLTFEGADQLLRAAFVFDILIPGPLGWMPFVNLNPANTDDSDFFVRADGAIGIGSLGYSASGIIKRGQWHRVILNLNPADGIVEYYVDGVRVHERAVPVLELSTLLSSGTVGGPPQVRLFNDNDGETTEVLVAAGGVITADFDETIAARLGAPLSGGVFAGEARPTISTIDFNEDRTRVSFVWNAVPDTDYEVEVSSDLSTWNALTSGLASDGSGALRYGPVAVTGGDSLYYRLRRE